VKRHRDGQIPKPIVSHNGNDTRARRQPPGRRIAPRPRAKLLRDAGDESRRASSSNCSSRVIVRPRRSGSPPGRTRRRARQATPPPHVPAGPLEADKDGRIRAPTSRQTRTRRTPEASDGHDIEEPFENDCGERSGRAHLLVMLFVARQKSYGRMTSPARAGRILLAASRRPWRGTHSRSRPPERLQKILPSSERITEVHDARCQREREPFRTTRMISPKTPRHVDVYKNTRAARMRALGLPRSKV